MATLAQRSGLNSNHQTHHEWWATRPAQRKRWGTRLLGVVFVFLVSCDTCAADTSRLGELVAVYNLSGNYPSNYNELYMLLSWSNDARSLSLGEGIITVPDGYHNDALLNPSFAAFTRGIYFSANTYLQLVGQRGSIAFVSSRRGEYYLLGSDGLDRAQFQKLQFGISLPMNLATQFSLVRHDIRNPGTVLIRINEGGVPSLVTSAETVKSTLYALTVSFRPIRLLALGVTGKYFRSQYAYSVEPYRSEWSLEGYSFDVGASVLNLLSTATFKPRLSGSRHFYSRFRDSVHAGFSAAVSLRDFGPITSYYSAWPTRDLPTTFKSSVSFVVMSTDELSAEVFLGFAQNFRGTWKEDFWDFTHADRSAACELTFFSLARVRMSGFQSDLNWGNGWGISIGPSWCQLEYANDTDQGVLTDDWVGLNDGRKVISMTLNYPFE